MAKVAAGAESGGGNASPPAAPSPQTPASPAVGATAPAAGAAALEPSTAVLMAAHEALMARLTTLEARLDEACTGIPVATLDHNAASRATMPRAHASRAREAPSQ